MEWKCPTCGDPSDYALVDGVEVATLCRPCYKKERIRLIHAKRPGEFNSLAWADLTANPRPTRSN
jgi:NMD protein affecting ribosome stability and mRNA decay